MSNHHLLVETPDGNRSKGMRHLNDVYMQAMNRRHTRTDHLFQGCFKAGYPRTDITIRELTPLLLVKLIGFRLELALEY